MYWSTDNIADQLGKIAIVTGSNSGIGFEVAKALAEKNTKLILACRNEKKAYDAKARILTTAPDAQIAVRKLDLTSLKSVAEFAQNISHDYPKIDLLINNAGVMIPPLKKTEDGFELQLASNHLGHFALTGQLLDSLEAAPTARVVSVSSIAHHLGKIDFGNLHAEKGYTKWSAYSQSKLANLLFTYELQRRLSNKNSSVIATVAHPGATRTGLQRHDNSLNFIWRLITQETPAGALPVLRAAVEPNLNGGEYFGPDGFLTLRGAPVREKSNKRSHDEKTAAHLWEESEKLTGISYLNR